MPTNLIMEQITNIEEYKEELSHLLKEVVDSGASIGFLPPLQLTDAYSYWESVLNPAVILLITKVDNQIVGTVQVHLCTKQNGTHRAEIAKLMTNPQFQRMGIARSLMLEAEKRIVENARSLIVLDTREGDVSNYLYNSLGYNPAGKIPNFAISANGELDATIIYNKLI